MDWVLFSSRKAGCKVQQKSAGTDVKGTTETETGKKGAQLYGRGQGEYIVLFLCCVLIGTVCYSLAGQSTTKIYEGRG